MIDLNQDAIIACVKLADRAGAVEFEIGHDAVIAEMLAEPEDGMQGARVVADGHRTPSAAAMDLAERLLSGATCRCGKVVALADKLPGCRWRLLGDQWTPGCDAPPIRVRGARGDMAAMEAALAEQVGRRPRP